MLPCRTCLRRRKCLDRGFSVSVLISVARYANAQKPAM